MLNVINISNGSLGNISCGTCFTSEEILDKEVDIPSFSLKENSIVLINFRQMFAATGGSSLGEITNPPISGEIIVDDENDAVSLYSSDLEIESSTITLNINGTGAKQIVKYIETTENARIGIPVSSGEINCHGGSYIFSYDGTYYVLVGGVTGTEVDSELDATSTNPIQNSIVTTMFDVVNADIAELQYRPTQFYCTCTTTASTKAKVANIVSGENFQLVAGVAIDVYFTNYNTASSPTLNVNNTGAKSIKIGGISPYTYQWNSGEVMHFVYAGGYWNASNPSAASETYYGVTKLSSSTSSTSTSLAATPSAVKKAYDLANAAIPKTQIGVASGVASLDEDGKVLDEQLPNMSSQGMPTYYATCETAAATAAKVVTVDEGQGDFVLEAGISLDILFTYTNTASTCTLNVNNTGAKSAYAYGITTMYAYMWKANDVVRFVYNGTNWILSNPSHANTSYYGVTKLSNSVSSTDTSIAATPYAVKLAYDVAVSKADKNEATTTTAGLMSASDKTKLDGIDLSQYMPLAGGEFSGDIRLKTGGSVSGSVLRFGDGDYVYIKEPDDDYMEIHAAHSIRFTGLDTASSNPLPISQGGTGSTTAAGAFAALGGQPKWDVLWTNSSPSSSFAAQKWTVTGLSNYNFFAMSCVLSTSFTTAFVTGLLYIPDKTSTNNYLQVAEFARSSLQNNLREFTFNMPNNQISADTGYFIGTSGATASTDRIIPVYLFGTNI